MAYTSDMASPAFAHFSNPELVFRVVPGSLRGVLDRFLSPAYTNVLYTMSRELLGVLFVSMYGKNEQRRKRKDKRIQSIYLSS